MALGISFTGGMRIEALSRARLDDAKRLLNRVFPEQLWWERSDIALPLSLAIHDPRPTRRFPARCFLAAAGLTDVMYWVAVERDRVCAISGLYMMRRDRHEAAWGAWTAVDPDLRGGLARAGGLLIAHAVNEGCRRGIPLLRLYTYADDRAMQRFLARRNFRLIREKTAGRPPRRIRIVEAPFDSLRLSK